MRKPRIYHESKGNPCARCGKPEAAHPRSLERRRQFDKGRKRSGDKTRRIIGIDGEGADIDGRHRYTYLCAADEFGRVVAEARNPQGLTHEQCVAMLLSLPKASLKVSFMFSYDTTKIIENWTLGERYLLLRPQLLSNYVCRVCKKTWRAIGGNLCPVCSSPGKHSLGYLQHNGRTYRWFAGSLTVNEGRRPKGGYKRSVQVWDCFRFFGCSFVQALKNWKIGSAEEVESIESMKGQRGNFHEVSEQEIEAYCQKECVLLAQLMRKVIESHRTAGIELTRYEGAGSSASALLKKHEVSKYRGELPENDSLKNAVACAFFGGRFENSFVGLAKGPIYSADIASAYPYSLYDLPCLQCGSWRRTAQIPQQGLAVVRYRVRPSKKRNIIAWAPLPFRDADGSITYPLNCRGWAWLEEALAAQRHWPDLVELAEAWVYETTCEHRPFEFMGSGYRTRVQWGKDGPGLALKLALNACYGKTAQSVGVNPPYRSLVWAGACTSRTRAMLLDAIASVNNRWDVLAVATDGVYSRSPLTLPKPRDTGTYDLPKPLGLWEEDECGSVYFCKPGLYFKADSSENDIRARGIGRREVGEQRDAIVNGLKTLTPVEITSRRFFGAKHSINAHSKCLDCDASWPGAGRCPECGRAGFTRYSEMTDASGVPVYGQWGERKIEISFDAWPKREKIRRNGRMTLRDVGGRESAPYLKGLTSPEGLAIRAEQDFLLEQPDLG